MELESLPVELLADVLGHLNLESLIILSQLSQRLRQICSDPTLNPWRAPILRNLQSGVYEDALKHLSERSVPRHNYIEILSLAASHFLLFEATLPNLKSGEWEECVRRRFLPSWTKINKGGSFRETFKKLLHRTWHRANSTCTSDEAWTKYIVLNRNGSANALEISSRGFQPLALFNEMKLQSNLAHLETRVRLVVQFQDVRILAFGVLNKPKSSFSINSNARLFLHPPGIDMLKVSASSSSYTKLTHPLPALSHANYPFYTGSGVDKRWLGAGELEEEGLQWVGGLMIIAQLIGPNTLQPSGADPSVPVYQDLDLVVGPGRSHYGSFTWDDLRVISPWMDEHITKRIDGPGLGN